MNSFKTENIAEIEVPNKILIKDTHNDSEDGQYKIQLDVNKYNWTGIIKCEEEFKDKNLIKSKSSIILSKNINVESIKDITLKTSSIYGIGAETFSYFDITIDNKYTQIWYCGDQNSRVYIEEYYYEDKIQGIIINIENNFNSTRAELTPALNIKSNITNTYNYDPSTKKKLTYKDKYSILKDLIEEDPCIFAEKHKLKDVDINVLKGWMSVKTYKWIESNAEDRKDNRSNFEFAQDLVMSRVLELYLIDYFRDEYGYELKLNGCDKEDILETENTVTTDADLIDLKGNLMEVISDKGNFWKKYNNNSFDLRHDKYKNMTKKSKELKRDGNKYSIIAVNMVEKKYQRIEVNENLNAQYRKYIPQFKKSGYNIKIEYSNYKDFKRVNKNLI